MAIHALAASGDFAQRLRWAKGEPELALPVSSRQSGTMENVLFSWDSEVRDYECDQQGIVNNARYQHYLEHARHLYLKSRGIDFSEVTARGIYLIVTRIEIDYKFPLRGLEPFRVQLRLERLSRIRFVFEQEILRLPEEKLCIKARVFTAAMNEKGRPMLPRELEDLLPPIPEE